MTGAANGQNIERRLYEAYRRAGGLLPTTVEEVAAERREQEGQDVAPSLPVHLRDPRAVLARIKEEGEQGVPHVFGRLILMMRVKNRLTISELAEKVGIEEEEVEKIENDQEFEPKPRTVSSLAKAFGVVPKNLARVANLTRRSDDRIFNGVVQFAAYSNQQMDKLTREQKKALQEFVQLLSTDE